MIHRGAVISGVLARPVLGRLGLGLTLVAVLAGARPAAAEESRVRLGAHGIYGSDTELGVGCDSVIRLSGSPRVDAAFSFDEYLPRGFDYSAVAVALRLGPGSRALGFRPYLGAGVRIARSGVTGPSVVGEWRRINVFEVGWSVEDRRRSSVSAGPVALAGLELPRQHLFVEARFESGGGDQIVAHVGILF